MANRERSRHTPKSRAERDYYSRLIKQQDFEPTKSESIDFQESSDKDEDYSIQKASKPRRRPLPDLISEHLKDNMAGYILSIGGIILLYFMVESKIDLATIKEKINGMDTKSTRIESEVKDLESKIDKNSEKLHEQEILVRENKIRIEGFKESKNQPSKNKKASNKR